MPQALTYSEKIEREKEMLDKEAYRFKNRHVWVLKATRIRSH
jgi:hypothetical protein